MVSQLALTVLAQGRGEHEVGGSGPGIAIIIGALIVVAIIGFVVFRVIARATRASHGGVEPPRDEKRFERHPQAPPLESIERRS